MFFYKLTQTEWCDLACKLKPSELKVLIYIKTSNPFGVNTVKVNCTVAGELLDLDPRTIGRCLRSLAEAGYIGEIEILEASIKVKPPQAGAGSADPDGGSGDPGGGSFDPDFGSCDPGGGSNDPNHPPQTIAAPSFQKPLDQIRSDQNFLDRSDQEEEEKLTFDAIAPEYREFLNRKASRLPDRPNNLRGWIVAMAQRRTYLGEFEAKQRPIKVPAPAAAATNFSDPAEYARQMRELGKW